VTGVQTCALPISINAALVNYLSHDEYSIFVTIDDDIILPENWQHSIACAFDRIPKLGVCGIDMAGSAEGEAYMSNAMSCRVSRYKDIYFRDTTYVQNVAGACMAMPTRVALKIGQYPFANDGRKYHIDEDGWRCYRSQKMGYKNGYVVSPNGVVKFLVYQDDEEYLKRKVIDTELWYKNPNWEKRQ
jgi:hypothetical protein